MNGKILFSGLLLLSVSVDSFAEEIKNTDAVVLEKIIVTASKTEKKITEVPCSATVISEGDIEASNARSASDLLKNLEGIYVYDSSGVGTNSRVNMRGFWGGMSTHQLILIDGVPQNKAKDKLVDWDLISLDNIKSIEVVRGPASCLYGDNAFSGVINIITKEPADMPETKIAASYGSFNTQKYKISTSGLFKNMGYYFDAGRKSSRGFRKYCDYENIHTSGKLDFLFGEAGSLKLAWDYNDRQRGAYPWSLTEAQIEQDRRAARPGSEADTEDAEKTNISMGYDKEITEKFDVKTIFYYRREDSGSFYTSSSSTASTKEQIEDEEAFGVMPRLSMTVPIFGVEHLFMAGVDMEKDDFDYDEYAAPYQVRGNINSDYSVDRKSIGPYIQDEIKIFDALRITGGLRYDSVEFDFTNHIDEDASKDKKMSNLSPRCGAVYNYMENSRLYANYAGAFRTPSLGQLFTYGRFANAGLNPEEADNYEIGITHDFNDYFKVNLSSYWMKLDNEIAYDYESRQYKNYSKTSHEGIELRLDSEIMRKSAVFFNYTYTRAKNESGDFNGKYLTNIPIHKGSLGLNFDSGYGLKAYFITNRVGSSYLDEENENKLAAYTTVDTKISYEYKNWTAFLAVDNLLDEEYNSYGYEGSRGVKYFNPAPERTFTVGMEAKF